MLYVLIFSLDKMVLLTILGFITIILGLTQKIKGSLEVNSFKDEMIIFDFTNNYTTDEGWTEKSDTVREVGMSKAVLTIQSSQIFSRAILFTVLNPQPNGACFAGVRNFIHLNLEKYNNIKLKLRGQGENYNYKIVLRHKNKNEEPNPTYEQFFTAPNNKFDIISLPLDQFKPYYRGKEVNNTQLLDKSFITSFGIQIYGGVYLPQKQSGTSSLEIDWITATE